MEKWGYVRVSVNRKEQAAGWEDQIAKLEAMGCNKIFKEEASTRNERPVFDGMMAEATTRAALTGKTVTLCAAKLDRAFRDLAAADAAITSMPNANVIWHLPDVSDKPLDPKDPGQMLLMRMMGAVAQFERDRLAERRAYGIAKAKADGKYKGRKPTARAKSAKVVEYRYERGMKPDEIAKLLDIGRASVFRILKDHKVVQDQQTDSFQAIDR
ncbi:MAG: recombinase family protein [Rhodobacteraceae bacterium]|nr:recombinase family protein [Paracoccaceae bacterium]